MSRARLEIHGGELSVWDLALAFSVHNTPISPQLITSPTEEHRMYVQQRDHLLENVCEMAIRKLSIITIFGNLENSTMKIDHYQLGEFCFACLLYARKDLKPK